MTSSLIKSLAICYPRDRWAIEMLAEHRVLTTRQLTALGFADDATHTSRRLRVLRRRGWLDSYPTGRDTAWYLGPLGTELTVLAGGRPEPPQPGLIEANQFFVDLAAYARTQRHTDLRNWRSPGYGEYLRDGKRIGFWYQPDDGERPHRWLYWHRILAEDAGVGLVLVTTLDPALHEYIDPGGLTVATSHPELGHPAGPVWVTQVGGERVALHDLPASEPLDPDHSPHPIYDPRRPGDEAIADGAYSYVQP